MVWEFVPLTAFQPPPADVVETARRRASALWHKLHPEAAPSSAEPVATGLAEIPAALLRRVAPPPDWAAAAPDLDVALEARQAAAGPAPVCVLVTPPYIDRQALLSAWAPARGWHIVTPPTPEQILSDGVAWVRDRSPRGPWVLPHLERLYLRHIAGLDLIRAFLDQVHTGAWGPGLIGCDSWAWAFLGHVWGGSLPQPLTLQAFDQARLGAIFRRLAAGHSTRITFRESHKGDAVLPSDDGDDPPDDFLRQLAAASRGNLGVAWAIWRAALCTEPEGDDVVPEVPNLNAAERTIWVTPWAQLTWPDLPAQAGRHAALVLHALLLHRGLALPFLHRLLPLIPQQVTATLDALWASGVVEQREGRWQVTALGYPTVREFLQSAGYLVDAF